MILEKLFQPMSSLKKQSAEKFFPVVFAADPRGIDFNLWPLVSVVQ